jgi:hypothetical protein
VTLFIQTVFFLEPFDAAGGVDQFLLAGEKRVAGRADFQADLFPGGTGLEPVSAGAADGYLVILRMNLALHFALTKTFILPKIVALHNCSSDPSTTLPKRTCHWSFAQEWGRFPNELDICDLRMVICYLLIRVALA